MKRCNRCWVVKAAEDFYAGRRDAKCRQCLAELRRDSYIAALENYAGPRVTEKFCSMCRELKPADEFYKQVKSSDGLHWNCKDCCKRSAKESVKRRPKEVISAYHRAKHLRDSYGITVDEFNEMVSAQQSQCMICSRVVDQLVVDHDHETGRVRDLLCGSCNSAIGLLGDDPERLEIAKQYLLRHKVK